MPASHRLRPDEDTQAGIKNVEERAVSAIAGPLYAALRDNPALVANLTAAKQH